MELERRPGTLQLTVLKCRIREGLAGPQEPALLTSAGRMPERSQHRVSGGQDGQSERPAMGSGQPRTAANSSGASVNSRMLTVEKTCCERTGNFAIDSDLLT